MLRPDAYRKETSLRTTRSRCRLQPDAEFRTEETSLAKTTRVETNLVKRDADGSLVSFGKNYPSSSADECELPLLLGGRRGVCRSGKTRNTYPHGGRNRIHERAVV